MRANRTITVKTEQERQAAPMDANTNKITSGKSNGWALIYCKGPDGEQLEFVQALNPVKQVFANALAERRRVLAAAADASGIPLRRPAQAPSGPHQP